MSNNIVNRFSLLLLEPGEFYFCDYDVTYRVPVKDRDDQIGWERSWFQDEIRGRLKICSKSLIFDPRVKEVPLLKLPLKHCIKIEGNDFVKPPTSDNEEEVYWERDTLTIQSNVVIEILENCIIRPYTFRKEQQNVSHIFDFSIEKIPEVLKFILQLQRAATLPLGDHNTMIQAILRSIQARRRFPYNYIPEAEYLLEALASKVTPLVTNPGRILISKTMFHFYPLNNIEKERIVSIPFNTINKVIRRRYLLQHVGIEIFYKKRVFPDHLYLIFKEPIDRDNAYKCLMKQEKLGMKKLGREFTTYKWQLGIISNFEYLTFLNSEADRSVNDLTQYPVFPWVIADYTSQELDLNDRATFRDLTKPVGALNEERLNTLKDRYDQMPDTKFLFGSHYSTPGFALFYLVREHPHYMLCLQNGKFDHPDRMFNSITDTWQNVITNASDFKELVPEFYDTEDENTGRFLRNALSTLFGTRQNSSPVWDVELPPWAKNSTEFVKKMKEGLESNYASYNINHWIDLIFGYKQKGKEAVKVNNVFYPLCYEGTVDLGSITDLNEKIAIEIQIMEFGQIPVQLFRSPHVQKDEFLCRYNDENLLKGIRDKCAAGEGDALNNDNSIALPKHFKLYSFLPDIAELAKNRLHLKAVTYLAFTPHLNKIMSLGRDGFLKGYYLPDLRLGGNYDSKSLAFSYCVPLPGTTEVLLASWNNYLYKYNYKLGQCMQGLQAHSDGITCLDINDSVVVTGSWDSLVRVWDVTKMPECRKTSVWSTWRVKMDNLICQMDHDGPVHCLQINPKEQLFASATKFGFINVWHLTRDLCFLNKQYHEGPVTGLSWSPDGKSIMSCGIDGKIILIDSDSGNIILTYDVLEELRCMKWDGRIAILGTVAGYVLFFDAAKRTVIHNFPAHEGPVTALNISPNEIQFATGGEDRIVKLWGLKPPEDSQ